MKLKETTIKSTDIFNGKVFKVKYDKILLPDESEASREVVEHSGGVVIAAIDEQMNVYLVEQYRYAVKEVVLELPAGKLEPGEDPFEAAVRELQEETGLLSEDLKKIGEYYASPGFCSERLHMYITRKTVMREQNLDQGEFLNVKKMPLSEAVELVMSDKIKDGKTKALLLMAEKLISLK